MWIKIDDGIAGHPKIIQVGPLGFALQMRAICYANKHHTDGFLPAALIPSFTYDLGPNDWPDTMVKARLWEVCDGGYRLYAFLEWNLSKQEYLSLKETFSTAGKRGAKIRWNKKKNDHSPPHGLAHSLPNGQAIASLSTSTSTSISLLSSPNASPEFEQFWSAYPRKVGKLEARKAWRKATARPPIEEILTALERARGSEQWQKGYIPNPATWLNQGRWDDQPTMRPLTAVEKFLQRGAHDERRIPAGLDAPHDPTLGQGLPKRQP